MSKGDFTRRTEDPGKHYSSVQMQQGRVQTDADWNEQVAIDAHLRETGVRDVVGPCGAPQKEGGFRIDVAVALQGIIIDDLGDRAPAPDLAEAGVAERDTGDGLPFPFPFISRLETLAISSGRMYLDGILVELESQTEVPITAGSEPNLVTVSASALHQSGVEKGDWVQIISDFPEIPLHALVEEILPADLDQDLQTVRLSTPVSDGFRRPRLRRVTTYTTQPDLPGAALPASDGTYLAYLHVWRRHLTWLDDQQIRETALGGPDTATRMKTVWQVKLFKTAPGAHCLSPHPAETAPSTGRLRARTRPAEDPQDPCIVPSKAGYTRLENQLYRVEVHKGGTLPPAPNTDSPTFKWSKDNGSIATEWLSQDGDKLTVRSIGRDAVLRFEDGGWLEILDDGRELRGVPGVMLRAKHVEGDVIEIDPSSGTVDIAQFSPVRKVWRWDSEGALRIEQAADNDGFLALEGGIEVRFETGSYRTGDYWLIPARAFIGEFSGDIEWPREGGATGAPLALPPHGIEHHYCRLAVLRRNTTRFFGVRWEVLSDCRPLFPPLTELTRLVELCACDQEALPNEELPEPLTVQVVNGQRRVPNASVLFVIAAGGGSLRPEAGQGVPAGFVKTKSSDLGLASCRWTLGQKYESQRVTAYLLDAAGAKVGPDVCFTARQIVPLLHALCGNGQQVLPGHQLPVDLAVQVWIGELRELPKTKVRFRALDKEGSLQPLPAGAPGLDVVAETGADDIARCRWVAGSSKLTQRVEASLFLLQDDLDGDGRLTMNDAQQLGPAVCFTVTLLPARPIFFVENVLDERNRSVANDAPFDVLRLAEGLRFACTQPVATESVGAGPGFDTSQGLLPPKSTCTVTLYMQWPPDTSPAIAFQPLVLSAVVTAEGNVIHWRPTIGAESWLRASLFPRVLRPNTPAVLARFSLEGGFIWTPKNGEPIAWLAGETRGRGANGRVDLVKTAIGPLFPGPFLTAPPAVTAEDTERQEIDAAAAAPAPDVPSVDELPSDPFPQRMVISGSGLPAGDFVMWVWIVPPRLELTAAVQNRVIFGTVRDASGFGLPDADVRLFKQLTGHPAASGRTVGGGNFRFPEPGSPGLEDGLYQVTALSGGLSATKSNLRVGSSPLPIPPADATSTEKPQPAQQTLSPSATLDDVKGVDTVTVKTIEPSPEPVKEPLLDDIKGIGPVSLKRLQEAGITRPDEVAVLEPARLGEILKMSGTRATTIIEDARKMTGSASEKE